jgi:hypothetical protein
MSGLRFAVHVICTRCGHSQHFNGAAVDFQPALADGRWPEGMQPTCPTCGPLTFDPKRLRMPYDRSGRARHRQRGDGADEYMTIRGIPTRI